MTHAKRFRSAQSRDGSVRVVRRDPICERRHRRLARYGVPFVLALLATGCQHFAPADAHHDLSRTASPAWRLEREHTMNARWQNRPLSELVQVRGEPPLILTIPGGGNPPGFAAVYDLDRASGCVDAFALLYGRDPTIRIYHCR